MLKDLPYMYGSWPSSVGSHAFRVSGRSPDRMFLWPAGRVTALQGGRALDSFPKLRRGEPGSGLQSDAFGPLGQGQPPGALSGPGAGGQVSGLGPILWVLGLELRLPGLGSIA